MKKKDMKENQHSEDSWTHAAPINKDKLVESDIGLVEEIFELCKNLTSMESHAKASYNSTKDERWLSVVNEVRQIRTRYLELITKKNFGQIWCYNKHSCESSMRLDECSSRFLSTNQIEEAKRCSEDSARIYLLFLYINDFMKEENLNVKSSA